MSTFSIPINLKPLLLVILLLCSIPTLHGQLVIDTEMDPEVMVKEHLIGERVKVRNIRIRGRVGTYGYFKDYGRKPLMGEGLVFSTGNVLAVAGPNRKAKTTGQVGTKGDQELYQIAKHPTYDATGISFEFVPEFETMVFNFVFGSEEYVEYVNTAFNDVFGFFLQGPGYDGRVNLAVIPGTKTPISINSVNHILNRDFYIDNNYFDRRGKPLNSLLAKLDSAWVDRYEMDGLTKLIRIEAPVIPGKVYKIKIAICDVSDGIYDSAVMLEGKSFTSLPNDLEARNAILAAEASQFRRAFEPGVLGTGAPKPGPELLGGDPGEMVEELDSISEKPEEPIAVEPPAGPPKDWKLLVTFDYDSHALDTRATMQLDQGLMHIREHPESTLLVRGHTCDRGSRSYNQRLSRRRAEAVKAYLVKEGILSNQIEVGAFDYSEPRVENDSEDNRSKNRRVEVGWK